MDDHDLMDELIKLLLRKKKRAQERIPLEGQLNAYLQGERDCAHDLLIWIEGNR